jgi:myotubularin-related protein 14
MNDQLVSLFSLFAAHPGGSVLVAKDDAFNAKLNGTVSIVAALLRDYRLVPLDNRHGQLCASYPPEVLVVLGPRAPATNSSVAPVLADSVVDDDDGGDSSDSVRLEPAEDGLFVLDEDAPPPPPPPTAATRGDGDGADARELREWTRTVAAARLARVRTRFPVPVLAYGEHLLCRSSTLAHKLELMLNRSGTSELAVREPDDAASAALRVSTDGDSDSAIDAARRKDIELMKMAGVTFICDLMVEDRKQVYGVNVCSSEKVDRRDRYASFGLASMPYPGCEFFKELDQPRVVPPWPDSDPAGSNERFRKLAPCRLPTSREYRALDLVTLTQVYLKTLLQLLSVGGVSCHCISGWDRTPLFVSLMRISLWADGVAHESLSVDELLFLTVAYDWLLFGHQLRDRATRHEMIFCFCFDFLAFIEDAQFAITTIDARRSSGGAGESSGRSPVQAAPAKSGDVLGSSPVEISRIKSNNSIESGGSVGAASSWHVLDQERALSASSFDDNTFELQPRAAPIPSRRAARLTELRLRFRQLYDTVMKPALAKAMAAGHSETGGRGRDIIQYSKQLWRAVAEHR